LLHNKEWCIYGFVVFTYCFNLYLKEEKIPLGGWESWIKKQFGVDPDTTTGEVVSPTPKTSRKVTFGKTTVYYYSS